jgi:hypothetical protein
MRNTNQRRIDEDTATGIEPATSWQAGYSHNPSIASYAIWVIWLDWIMTFKVASSAALIGCACCITVLSASPFSHLPLTTRAKEEFLETVHLLSAFPIPPTISSSLLFFPFQKVQRSRISPQP